MKSILKKAIIFVMTLNFISINVHAIDFVGEGGLAMENVKGECTITTTSEETIKLKQEGFVPTKTGLCGKTPSDLVFCGPGSTLMKNYAGFSIRTLNSCETDKLLVQGWEITEETN